MEKIQFIKEVTCFDVPFQVASRGDHDEKVIIYPNNREEDWFEIPYQFLNYYTYITSTREPTLGNTWRTYDLAIYSPSLILEFGIAYIEEANATCHFLFQEAIFSTALLNMAKELDIEQPNVAILNLPKDIDCASVQSKLKDPTFKDQINRYIKTKLSASIKELEREADRTDHNSTAAANFATFFYIMREITEARRIKAGTAVQLNITHGPW